jgi:hypothetical protein
MTTAIRDFERSFVCGSSTLISKQYFAVKQDTDGTVVLAGANGTGIVGVLQNKPAVGKAALVRWLGSSKAIAGGAIAVGAYVTSDANGNVIATTTNKDTVLGRFIGTAAAASGDVVEIQIGIFTLSI